MLFIGIDVAKNKHDCCILSSDGGTLCNNLKIHNTSLGFNALLHTIQDYSKGCLPQNVHIALEASGIYSLNIERFLRNQGFSLVVFNPLSTNLFRKAQTLRKTKTDKVDCFFLAKMLLSGDYQSLPQASNETVELKFLTRHRHRLIKQQTILKISINRILDIVFPELQSVVSSIHQKSSYALLLELSNPKAIASCHLTKLTNLLAKSSQGHYGRSKAEQIKQLATNSIGVSSPSVAFELQQTIRLISNIQAEIELLDKHINQIMAEINSPILSIPGV